MKLSLVHPSPNSAFQNAIIRLGKLPNLELTSRASQPSTVFTSDLSSLHLLTFFAYILPLTFNLDSLRELLQVELHISVESGYT